VTIPLHSININVKGDKICRPQHLHKRHKTKMKILNHKGIQTTFKINQFQIFWVQRNPSVVDLSQENTKLISSNSHQPHVVNLPISPTTPTHSNTTIKRNGIMFFLLSLILQIKQ